MNKSKEQYIYKKGNWNNRVKGWLQINVKITKQTNSKVD